MEQQVRVEILPREIPVSAAHATKSALRLGEALQALNTAKVCGGGDDVAKAEREYRAADEANRADSVQDGWLARVNGVAVPVVAFAVEQAPDGSPVLLLQLTPDSLQIGDPSTGTQEPQVRPAVPAMAVWSTSAPDSLGAQVARNAAVPA